MKRFVLMALAEVAAIMFGLMLATAAHADEPPSVFFVQMAARHDHDIGSRHSPSSVQRGSFGETRGGLRALVTAYANKHGVPANIAHAVVQVESRYNCGATSSAGARGIMQVMPATARGVGVFGNLYNCATGLEAGMRYLRGIIAANGAHCASFGLYERGAAARPVCTRYGARVAALSRQ